MSLCPALPKQCPRTSALPYPLKGEFPPAPLARKPPQGRDSLGFTTHLPSGPPLVFLPALAPQSPKWHTQTGLALGPLPPEPGRILRSHLKPHLLRGHLEPHQSECPWYQRLPGAGQRCGLSSLAPSLPDHNLHLISPRCATGTPKPQARGGDFPHLFHPTRGQACVSISSSHTAGAGPAHGGHRPTEGGHPWGPLPRPASLSESWSLKPSRHSLPLCAGGHPRPSSQTRSLHLPPWRGVGAALPPLETGQCH